LHALRALATNPAFTLTAVAILAIGIGANSTMFSIVRSVLLRPIPWEEPDRLALLEEVQHDSEDATNPSTANYVDVRDQSDVFERTAAFRFVYFNLSDRRADPERIQGLRLTSDFFRLIGIKPMLGRLFLPEEEQPGRDCVVLLASALWRQRYLSDPAIVGKTVILEGEPYSVVGVLPEFPIFHVLNRPLEIYAPLGLRGADLSRQDHSISVYVQLRRGVSLKIARSEMKEISRRLATEHPETNSGLTLQLTPLADTVTRNRRTELEFLMAATAFRSFDCLREHRKPDIGIDVVAAEGVGDSHGAGSRPGADRSAAYEREPGRRLRRRWGGVVGVGLGCGAPESIA
jgi:putative ABC transport system permease protein